MEWWSCTILSSAWRGWGIPWNQHSAKPASWPVFDPTTSWTGDLYANPFGDTVPCLRHLNCTSVSALISLYYGPRDATYLFTDLTFCSSGLASHNLEIVMQPLVLYYLQKLRLNLGRQAKRKNDCSGILYYSPWWKGGILISKVHLDRVAVSVTELHTQFLFKLLQNNGNNMHQRL